MGQLDDKVPQTIVTGVLSSVASRRTWYKLNKTLLPALLLLLVGSYFTPFSMIRTITDFHSCIYFRYTIYFLAVPLAINLGRCRKPLLWTILAAHAAMTAARVGFGVAISDWRGLAGCTVGKALLIAPFCYSKDAARRAAAHNAMYVSVAIDVARAAMAAYSGDLATFNRNYFGY